MLTESDARLVALQQRVRFATGRMEDVVGALELVAREMAYAPDHREQIEEQVLALKYTIDFTLGGSSL
jgi:hypothetical protein